MKWSRARRVSKTTNEGSPLLRGLLPFHPRLWLTEERGKWKGSERRGDRSLPSLLASPTPSFPRFSRHLVPRWKGVSEGTEWVRKEAPGPSTSKERDVREWRAGWKGFLLLSSIFLVGTSSHRRTLRSLLCLLGSPLLRSHFTSLRGSCGAYRIYNREFFSTSLITGVKLVGLESLRHGNRKKNKMIKE